MKMTFFTIGLILSLWSCQKNQDQSVSKHREKQHHSGIKFVLPEENKVPLTLEGFCSGIPNVQAITSQNITQELEVLCSNGTPSTVFQQIYSNPYQGSGNTEDFIVRLPQDADLTGELVQIFIAYGMKIPKNAVPTLIAEEPIALLPYQEGILTINAQFLAPPENQGDADTSFIVEQTTDVNRQNNPQVIFKDISKHRLNMYRLHPNNFDFFMAARTLMEETEQFKKSNIVRGVMADPENPDASTYVFSIVNVIMNSRGDPDGNIAEGTTDTFFDFFNASIANSYNAQTQ
ncbi:hypothetical protein [Pseudobacteriovorax antillogorgiicola]|uniref:Uncharacterized protein n=1 Tax=Pseudobacteriovorax antillogorgiicola TaxID=1513793 RepID=A0A1Y6BSG4_9BACT|nr:hypothetical protein [Pseudobacteriovorax antillogorgiicola]TCS54529.1 hypothetical protein EDD56_10642 [Pseudobacteriovorax antillogorgiicola]SMF18748.1 hypothetical protein SAMN06296036_106201 [Pseudobacteriovorax antillogorgiicola]